MRLSFCVQINHRSEFSFGTFPDRNGWMKMKKNEMEVATVGGRIKYLRKQIGMSQEELAERLHLENRASISSYETNRRGLTGELAVAIAQELQTTTDYLLNGTETEDAFTEEAMSLIRKVKTEAGKKAVLLQLQAVLELENHNI